MKQSDRPQPVSLDPFLTKPYRAYIRLHWRPFLCGTLALAATNSLDALAPLLVGMAIDEIVAQAQFNTVLKTVGIIFAVTSGLAVCRFLWRYFWGTFHHTVAEDIRNRLFAHFTRMGPSFFTRKTTGDLMSLINNDVNMFRMAIGPGVLVLFDSIFIVILVPFLMWRIAPSWTWKCLIMMPIVPFMVRFIMNRTYRAYRGQQERFSAMAGAAQEIVSGIRVIKSYAQEENQVRLFNSHSRRYQEACNQVAQVDSAFGPVLEIAAMMGSVILVLISAPMVVSGAVSVGLLFAFYQYIQKMVWPMEGIGVAFSHFQVGNAAFLRIREILATPADTPTHGSTSPEDIGKIDVRDLTFTYPGEIRPALKNISFQLSKGEVLGVVGATGAGKTTLAEVLCHLYPVEKDCVFYDQVPIEDIEQNRLRDLIAMVPQETFVFSQPIGENILFGVGDGPAYSVEDAAGLVKLDEEVSSWPEGYQTLIGERGVNLSGGQRQRVTMARALIRRSPLVIIDDALSAVDAKTGEAILGNLKERLQGSSQCAAIVISHRLANVSWADKILVLDQGKMEALGSHDELLNCSPTYRQLHELQNAGDAT